ncbi:MAG: hypothetical protein A2527_13875 [Candidatus Lambdaproteobacteria bacterium RIFOXYD2_FULL_50_16]|uniref:histidine kinase n=1 Tax=Candidatus Lambdaproteobacteria bacterium RIFOXYD2_FULL_50_16 TaxID=1817772 RepID=A0A1F6G4J9_9PROT|nr:MAG: hypothetical protein A2527_13875 [Candidatus Lambdaproteobacteria bacterium RIFOXYD2_FULL_50_16]
MMGLWLLLASPAGALPLAQEGRLDLRGLESLFEAPIPLKGDWKFYWGQAVTPETLDQSSPTGPIRVPSLWWDAAKVYSQVKIWGVASYHLFILLPPETPELVLSIPILQSASKVFVNGQLAWARGQVGDSYETSKPSWMPSQIDLPKGLSHIDLLVQVSNFNHVRGGMTMPFVLGARAEMAKRKSYRLLSETLIFTCLLLTGLYNLALCLYRRNDHLALYFSLTCISLSARLLVTGEMLTLDWFPDHYELLIKARNFPDYLALIFFCLYTHASFPNEFSSRATRIFVWGLGFGCVSILLNARWLTFVMVGAEVLIGIAAVWGIGVAILALYRGREGAKAYALGFALFGPTAINDVLHANGVIHTQYLAPYGMAIFFVTQALGISYRFSTAFVAVQALSEELNKKNQDLEELNLLKDQFLANTSHELKSPLQGIIGIIESFPPEEFANLTQKGRDGLRLVGYSARRLANLVNDLLDIAQIRDKRLVLHLEPTDLKVASEWVCQLCEPSLKKGKAQLQNQIPEDFPWVNADPQRLQQIFYNLIDNAIKFTPSGLISISAFQEGTRARIEVSDQGMGMDQRLLAKVLEPFVQGEGSMERAHQGSGLGLSISENLIRLQGGSIEIKSSPGLGTKVIFYLDLAVKNQSSQLADKPTSAYEPQLSLEPVETSAQDLKSGPYILIVDDEPASALAQQNLLEQKGYQVQVAYSGKEGLELIKHRLPELILADLMMPRMSGLQFCQLVRERWDASDLPVLILTAQVNPSVQLDSFDQGANDYVAKPYDPKELIARIENQLKLKELSKLRRELDSLKEQDSENLRNLLVRLMTLCLTLWEQKTGKSKLQLAETSGIWTVYLDGTTYKTRTLDRYLQVARLPAKPRWRDVVGTANFILAQIELDPDQRQQVEKLRQEIEGLMALA